MDGIGVPFVFDGDDDGEGFGISNDTSLQPEGGRLMFTSYKSSYDI